MKYVEVVIDGTINILEYCSQSHYDKEEYGGDTEDAFYSEYHTTIGWEKIEGIYLREIKSKDDADEYLDTNEYENVMNKKGKNVETKEYFHHLFAEDSDHPIPVDIHSMIDDGHKFSYVVELEDDEEFDIGKVQIVKSMCEIVDFLIFYLAEYILYDGKKIEVCDKNGRYSEKEIGEDYYNQYTEYCLM